MWTAWELFWAGSWGVVWHWGTGVGIIILCLVGAFASNAIPVIGPFLGGIRKPLLWVAASVAFFLGGEYVGGQDQIAKCVAKTVVIERTVDRVVRETTPVPDKKPLKKGQKRVSPSDQWDNPEN